MSASKSYVDLVKAIREAHLPLDKKASLLDMLKHVNARPTQIAREIGLRCVSAVLVAYLEAK